MNKQSVLIEKLFHTDTISLKPQTPFQWSSGLLSPIYCDNRKLLSYPIHRDYIKSELANVLLQDYPTTDYVVGVATAGIPWGILVADQTKLPFLYVRPTAKEHGLGKNIEGVFEKRKKVLVIEDLISTGKSSLAVVEILKQNELNPQAVVSIFNYGFQQTQQDFQKIGIPFKSLLEYSQLIDYAEKQNKFSAIEIELLRKWERDPKKW